METKPWDAFLLGYADAHTNTESQVPYVKVKYKTPKACEVCVGCLRAAINLDGMWKFYEVCVYCSGTGFARRLSCPLFLKHPPDAWVDNPYYVYGYLRGVAAQAFLPINFGGRRP